MIKKISSKQMMYSASCIIIATSLLTKSLYVYLKHEAWIAIILGFSIKMVIIFVYTALANRFPGSNIININEKVFGVVLGKVFSALYVYFFFTLACLNVNVMGGFVNGMILPQTPMVLILVLFVAVCAWAVRKGPVNLLRMSTVFVLFTIAFILINNLLLVNIMDLKNFLPLFSIPIKNYLIGAHFVSIIPFSEVFVLFMFLPDMQKPEAFGKSLRYGVVIGAAVYLIIVLRDIAVLGPSTDLFANPSFAVLRFTNIGEILTRIEIIYVLLLIIIMFFKVAAIFYGAVKGFQQLMNFSSYQFLILILGSLMVLYSAVMFGAGEHAKFLENGAAVIHSTFFLVILPAVTLLVAAFRNISYKKGTNQKIKE
ncbi:MAG: hypothetical protein EOM23_05400 [Candidatus Moranbacteria bacterium]|nr:hypothetical protein [Candidatus Moranbacteria bacterium]